MKLNDVKSKNGDYKSKGITGYVRQFNGVKRLCGDYELKNEISYLMS